MAPFLAASSGAMISRAAIHVVLSCGSAVVVDRIAADGLWQGGAIAPGLSLSASGSLAGTPTSGGSFNFTITSTDSTASPGPYSGSRAYTLTVNSPAIVVSPVSLSAAAIGASYSASISASGGTAGYNYAVSAGALPAGLSLSSTGVLSGTPTAGGSFSFTISATDSSTGAGP